MRGLLLLAPFIFSASVYAGDLLRTADYFPKMKGDRWVYQSHIKLATFVSAPFVPIPGGGEWFGETGVELKFETAEGMKFPTLLLSAPYRAAGIGSFYNTYFTNNDDGVTVYALKYILGPMHGDVPVSCKPFAPPILWLPNHIATGQTYSSKDKLYCTIRGMTIEESFSRKVKVLGFEDVTVPAGKFRALKLEHLVEFQMSGTQPYIQHDFIWLAPRVFLVKLKGSVEEKLSHRKTNEYLDELKSHEFFFLGPK